MYQFSCFIDTVATLIGGLFFCTKKGAQIRHPSKTLTKSIYNISFENQIIIIRTPGAFSFRLRADPYHSFWRILLMPGSSCY